MTEVIMTVNDRVAIGAYKAIRKLGLNIPEDVGIIGYGFSETAQLFSPSFDYYQSDPRKMGQLAVNSLIDEILLEEKLEKYLSIDIDEDFQWKNSVAGKA